MHEARSLLDPLVSAVLASPIYRTVCEDFVRRIGVQELEKRKSFREAVKATKNKLHQVGGVYFEQEIDYANWLNELAEGLACHCEEGAGPAKQSLPSWRIASPLKAARNDRFLEVCRRVMQLHASTRERLPDLERFYALAFAELPPIHSILDIACGLNPLTIPWMPHAPDVEYYAVDIYRDMIEFINSFLALVGVRGCATPGDVLGDYPVRKVDLALVLKTIPCLEQVDKAAGAQLLESIPAKHLLVSFPVHSLGGRGGKGMTVNYADRFYQLVADKSWQVRKLEFPTELAFLVTK